MTWEQLTRAGHGALRINPERALASAAATVHLVPLAYSEIRRAAVDFPVVLVKDGETGQFYPAALMGLAPHENLFWDGAGLDAGHVPLNLARVPFGLGGADLGSAVVCIDTASPALCGPDEGQPILDADGHDSHYITGIQQILGELAAQVPVTRAFVEALVGQRLVVPLRLDVALEDGSSSVLEGLYGLDEAALGAVLAAVSDPGHAMTLAAMALSLDRVGALVRRKNARAAAAATWFGPAA